MEYFIAASVVLAAGWSGYLIGAMVAGCKYTAKLREFRQQAIAGRAREAKARARAAISKATGE